MITSKQYLKHALYTWLTTAIVATTLLCCSCASMPQEKQWVHNCVANSIRDGWSWELQTGQPSRMAVSNIEPGTDHVQAQGMLPDGSWMYLTTHNSDGQLRVWTRHFKAEPYRYLTLDDWIKEQRKVRIGGLK